MSRFGIFLIEKVAFHSHIATPKKILLLIEPSMQFSLLKKSFTLIEMLIVIVIIGILAAALVPRLQDVQGRARDTKRKADLRTIYNANEIYLLDFGQYARPTNSYVTYNYNTTTALYSWHT